MRRTEQVEAPVQFNLASLLLTMTLICVCLGATASVPPVGIGLTILAVPAFVRTARRARRLRRRGVVMNVNECLSVFGASLGLVFASIVAGGLILYGTCTLTIVTAFPVVEALGAGTFATLLAAGLVILGLAAGLFGAGYVAWVIIKGAGEEADIEGDPPKS